MRRKLQMVIFLVIISSILLPSFYLHLSPTSTANDGHPTPPPDSAAALAISLKHHRQNLAILEQLLPPPQAIATESVLLPDWESLILLPPNSEAYGNRPLSCLFRNGATSPARFFGVLPSSSRPSFLCSLPQSVRRLRHLFSPQLIHPSTPPKINGHDRPPEMIRWNRLAYDSLSTAADVIVFAKGVNTRQGVNRPASDLRCVFSVADSGGFVTATAATSSAQEVFRCPHPESRIPAAGADVRVSLEIKGEKGAISSVAIYSPPPAAHDKPVSIPRSLICACTMVYNVAKFLREWVAYHSSIGVERFVLYDNGSDDSLDSVVSRLGSDGFNVTTRFWPWAKTQEAGFSHCAAANRDTCDWMAFLDVDEFIFSPAWSDSDRPNRSMLAILFPPEEEVGQVSFGCLDFGPSGQRSHPRGGVTQGYTCRRRAEERHKSVVRLDSVGDSLVNSVHHFELGDEWVTRRVRTGVVNHYKFQAWEEFKGKFRRRVSAYVADWKEAVNPGSKDRTPGLGFEPVEPVGWAGQFCEVNDIRLREVSRRWFGMEGPTGEYKMVWEEE